MSANKTCRQANKETGGHHPENASPHKTRGRSEAVIDQERSGRTQVRARSAWKNAGPEGGSPSFDPPYCERRDRVHGSTLHGLPSEQ
jgi:hypothetical protein